MLVVISPAKRLDFSSTVPKSALSQPDFQSDAFSLSKSARRLSVPKLRKLMSISEALAKRAQDQFKVFEELPDPDSTKPAILAFAGDTYIGLDAASLEAEELDYAQNHLRILSGLYGLLRPMDAIQPFRLEMGSRLATRKGKNLYAYWGNRLSEALNETAKSSAARFIINCASVEYFTALPADQLSVPVISPVFMEMRGDEPKIISFSAKRARGSMARFIIQNRFTDPDALQCFDLGGYRYQPDASTDLRPVFIREHTAENVT